MRMCYNLFVKHQKKGGGFMTAQKMADAMIGLSVLTAVVSGYVSISKVDVFGLAGTQWMMIAIVLGIYALYAKMRIAD